jgi:formylglycine-generating enzyme required for sulfatase activity
VSLSLLPLLVCGPQPAALAGAPSLPTGCSWVKAPTGDCPLDDAGAYQEWARQNGPVTVRHGRSGIELVWVPGGSLMMGSADGNKDERPVHRVTLTGSWIGRAEVTVEQWRSVIGSAPRPDNDQGDDQPVVDVSWQEAREFCRQAAGLVLPTEAQWEYAARGPDGKQYPWGDRWAPALCQSAQDLHGHARTAPVGSFPAGASWCGALDLAGNVWDWCRDRYAADFYQFRKTGRRDPECTQGGTGTHVIRGGSWNGCAATRCRSTFRMMADPRERRSDLGFRVAPAR